MSQAEVSRFLLLTLYSLLEHFVDKASSISSVTLLRAAAMSYPLLQVLPTVRQSPALRDLLENQLLRQLLEILAYLLDPEDQYLLVHQVHRDHPEIRGNQSDLHSPVR